MFVITVDILQQIRNVKSYIIRIFLFETITSNHLKNIYILMLRRELYLFVSSNHSFQ